MYIRLGFYLQLNIANTTAIKKFWMQPLAPVQFMGSTMGTLEGMLTPVKNACLVPAKVLTIGGWQK